MTAMIYRGHSISQLSSTKGRRGRRVKVQTYAIPEPIRSRRQPHTPGANGKREDLADDNPGARTPGGGEERDVKADEGDHSRDCGMVVLFEAAGGDADDADDELRDDHSGGADDEELAATEAFDGPEGQGGGADVDEGGDEGDQEGVIDRAQTLEEDGAEVEDEVDAGQLLHHLHEDTWCGAVSLVKP